MTDKIPQNKLEVNQSGNMVELRELKSALEQPFPIEAVQFLLKDVRQDEGKWTCLALPYCNKRIYEDRLNELAYGEWQTPYTAPYIHDNKLIIPATVVLCGVTHTDYGEAFLAIQSKNGTAREDENSATEAYSQAFRRACAKFGLGRYLYDLGKVRLPYDPKRKALALTRSEQLACVKQLYHKAGLVPPAASTSQQRNTPTHQTQKESAPAQEETHNAQELDPSAKQPTSYPNDTFLDWVAQQVARDAKRIQSICTHYKVQHLSDLNQEQRTHLTQRLKQQQRQAVSARS